ncbi:MAG: helix-turn-helix domain-containing protein [Acidobacteriota bacterium]
MKVDKPSAVREAVRRSVNQIHDDRRQTDDDAVATALAYMADHLTDPNLSITHLRTRLTGQPNNFSQRFQQRIGVTAVQYVKSQRAEVAAHLLHHTDMQMKEIADASGFRSATTMGRAIKELHGCTPVAYRKKKNKKPRHGSRTRRLEIAASSQRPGGDRCGSCGQRVHPRQSPVVYEKGKPCCLVCCIERDLSPALVSVLLESQMDGLLQLEQPTLRPPLGSSIGTPLRRYLLDLLVECVDMIERVPLEAWQASGDRP